MTSLLASKRPVVRRRLAEINSSAITPAIQLKQELYDYMKPRGSLVRPDQAARDLGYSVLDILEALKKLEKEGRAIETEDIHIGA